MGSWQEAPEEELVFPEQWQVKREAGRAPCQARTQRKRRGSPWSGTGARGLGVRPGSQAPPAARADWLGPD